jgi:UDP-N-acetyl-D-glucosamine dehydrogenase
MPFYPGPGLGGHCIPIDPFYLSWKARQSGSNAASSSSRARQRGMPEFVVERITDALNSAKKSINGSKIHLIGVAYKKDVGDVRESPALDILELLHRRGATLSYSDPFVPSLKIDGAHAECRRAGEGRRRLRGDLHEPLGVRLRQIGEKFPLIVDTRNALRGRPEGKGIFRL